ncbi:MAG: heavy-metal-associated domain-containing protein [Chloroflexi bacterium]|nr:heavy-metal-associated domain-containing protein [Chloroflexota bacterium]MBU1751611.1 heavy-metal-associated domain-containing protein [Chloroflexota bacterium]MBU1879839.1 heavy-metal-associated domain-containing protein [Chloroflexota bacterium]
MEKVILGVSDMSCQHCVMRVAKAISGQPGTADVQVDLDSKQATFQYDPAQATLDDIVAAIAKAGYTAQP